MRTKHYISLVVLSIVVIFGGLYLSIANPQPKTLQQDSQQIEESGEAKDIITLFLEDLTSSTGSEFSKVKNEKVTWKFLRGGSPDSTKIQGRSIKSTSITPAQQEAIFAYFINHGYTESSINSESGTLIGSKGYQKELNVCALAIEMSEDLNNETGETFMKISCGDINGDEEFITVDDLLKNPVYNSEIKVIGEILIPEEITSSYFLLKSSSEENLLEVWYDSMVEEDGTTWPIIDVQDYKTGDRVILTGFLQEEGVYTSQDEFWLVDIELQENQSATTKEDGSAAIANPASTNCIQQGGKTGQIVDEIGAIGYCLFDDGRVCEEWALFNGNECESPEATYTEEFSCSNHCQDFGYTDGSCLLQKEALDDDLFVGTCTVEDSPRCSKDGQCNCYCINAIAE